MNNWWRNEQTMLWISLCSDSFWVPCVIKWIMLVLLQKNILTKRGRLSLLVKFNLQAPKCSSYKNNNVDCVNLWRSKWNVVRFWKVLYDLFTIWGVYLWFFYIIRNPFGLLWYPMIGLGFSRSNLEVRTYLWVQSFCWTFFYDFTVVSKFSSGVSFCDSRESW